MPTDGTPMQLGWTVCVKWAGEDVDGREKYWEEGWRMDGESAGKESQRVKSGVESFSRSPLWFQLIE